MYIHPGGALGRVDDAASIRAPPEEAHDLTGHDGLRSSSQGSADKAALVGIREFRCAHKHRRQARPHAGECLYVADVCEVTNDDLIVAAKSDQSQRATGGLRGRGRSDRHGERWCRAATDAQQRGRRHDPDPAPRPRAHTAQTAPGSISYGVISRCGSGAGRSPTAVSDSRVSEGPHWERGMGRSVSSGGERPNVAHGRHQGFGLGTFKELIAVCLARGRILIRRALTSLCGKDPS